MELTSGTPLRTTEDGGLFTPDSQGTENDPGQRGTTAAPETEPRSPPNQEPKAPPPISPTRGSPKPDWHCGAPPGGNADQDPLIMRAPSELATDRSGCSRRACGKDLSPYPAFLAAAATFLGHFNEGYRHCRRSAERRRQLSSIHFTDYQRRSGGIQKGRNLAATAS